METMDAKDILFLLVTLYFYATVLCTDIEDCQKCSTQNLFLDNISTDSTAKQCWILRTHFIRYCDMCLRRCCASEENMQAENKICASTQSDWHRYERGRRIFYNDCAYFRYICEVEQPSRSLTWKCMFRRRWQHEDCDASSAVYENGRRKPGLYQERSPAKINCAKYSYLPQLEPCPMKTVATPAPLPPTTTASTTPTILPSTTIPTITPTANHPTPPRTTNHTHSLGRLPTPASKDAPTTPKKKNGPPTQVSTSQPTTQTHPSVEPVTKTHNSDTLTQAHTSVKTDVITQIHTSIRPDIQTPTRTTDQPDTQIYTSMKTDLTTQIQTSVKPDDTTQTHNSVKPDVTTQTQRPVVLKRTAQSIHSSRTISLVGTDYAGTVPDGTDASISLQSTMHSYYDATDFPPTLKVIWTENAEGGLVEPEPTEPDIPTCNCKNVSFCNPTVRSKIVSSLCPGRVVVNSPRETCASCHLKQPPPVFPICSFPQPALFQ